MVNVCFLKKEVAQINNLNLHLKKVKTEQTKPEFIRRQELTQIRAEINELENRKRQREKNQ